jgi:hypothetical protein
MATTTNLPVGQCFIRLSRIPDPTRPGKYVSRQRVDRWVGPGVNGIRLQSWPWGGIRVTTVQAIAEFLDALKAFDDYRNGIE